MDYSHLIQVKMLQIHPLLSSDSHAFSLPLSISFLGFYFSLFPPLPPLCLVQQDSK